MPRVNKKEKFFKSDHWFCHSEFLKFGELICCCFYWCFRHKLLFLAQFQNFITPLEVVRFLRNLFHMKDQHLLVSQMSFSFKNDT